MTTETIPWLGHSSFRLDAANGMRIYIDPWLTNPNAPHELEAFVDPVTSGPEVRGGSTARSVARSAGA